MSEKLTAIFNDLTDEQLQEAYANIMELQTKGELGSNNVFRNVHKKIEEEIGIKYSMHALEREFLFQISKRSMEKKIENKELLDALEWVVDQFEKVLASEKAGNVAESLSFAKSLLNKHQM